MIFGSSLNSDIIYSDRYLLDNYAYLDENRVGVWGWGYGGYVTTMLLGSQQDQIQCGIAVAPIVDWLYYSKLSGAFYTKRLKLKTGSFTDSVFTEKILGLPVENYKAYVEADATQRAKNFPSKSYFLVHGLADLSVPYQHGIQLARALTEANKLFKHQVSG